METATPPKEPGQIIRNELLVGIDLGTCRTAIMSNKGARIISRSVVGYAKDVISEQMVGSGAVIGQDAIDKRSFLDLCYPLADGVIREASERDYQAAYELMKNVVNLAKQGAEGSVCGIIGVPARASIMNKELLLDIAKELMTVALVVSEPFMVAYQLGKLHNCIVIDIGAGTVDICAMKGTVPAPDDQVTFLKGGDFIDQRLEAGFSLHSFRHAAGVALYGCLCSGGSLQRNGFCCEDGRNSENQGGKGGQNG